MAATVPVLLEVSLSPSLIHHGIAGCIYSAVLAALWLASVSAVASLLLTLVVILHGSIYTRLCVRSDIEGIRLYQDGWFIKRAGHWQKAWPAGQAVVNGWFISLPFKVNNAGVRRRISVVVFPDSSSDALIHALRLNLVLKGFGGMNRRY